MVRVGGGTKESTVCEHRNIYKADGKGVGTVKRKNIQAYPNDQRGHGSSLGN